MRTWGLVRGAGSYKQVPRPSAFKLVSRPEYEPASLAAHLGARIRAGGPMSVADYMRAVLTHPRKGYYMQGDVFGRQGDFTTSPEISPLFGEMVAVWFGHELRKINSPRPMQLVELGPGRGTLAADVIRVLRQIPPGDTGLSLHLVEVSDRLAQVQAQRLGVSDLTANLPDTSPHYQEGVTPQGLSIYWYKQLRSVPRAFSIYLAHEFFDALPIHKFQRVEGAWREVLVSLKNPEQTTSGAEPEFHLTVSRVANPPLSMLIGPDESRDHVELCPEAVDIVSHLAERLEQDGGVSLIVDYGHEGTKTDTFRGFKSHALHDPLVQPGEADLTADVDFACLRRAAAQRVCSFGPVSQREFLRRMNIEARLVKLLETTPPDQSESLKSGVKMVTKEMGDRFHLLALFPAVLTEHLARFPVAGFQDTS